MTKPSTLSTFLVGTTTTQTLLNATFSKTTNLTLRTRNLSLQRQCLTLRALLRLFARILQPYNNRVTHKPITTTITLLNTIYTRITELTGPLPSTLQHGLYYDYKRLTLESWFTNFEKTPLNRCQQLPAAYKRLVNRKEKQY